MSGTATPSNLPSHPQYESSIPPHTFIAISLLCAIAGAVLLCCCASIKCGHRKEKRPSVASSDSLTGTLIHFHGYSP